VNITIQEEVLLRQRFSEGMAVTELSQLHNRSRGAINSRLEHMGLIESKALT
jgi:hypothetical protein